jgi:hypothetical protein
MIIHGSAGQFPRPPIASAIFLLVINLLSPFLDKFYWGYHSERIRPMPGG